MQARAATAERDIRCRVDDAFIVDIVQCFSFFLSFFVSARKRRFHFRSAEDEIGSVSDLLDSLLCATG